MRVIAICMGSSCFARGNADNLRVIQEYVARHHMDATVCTVGHLCQDRCSSGPSIYIDGKEFNAVQRSSLPALLEECLKP